MSRPIPTVTLTEEAVIVNLDASYVEQALREWGLRYVTSFAGIHPAKIAATLTPDGGAIITSKRP